MEEKPHLNHRELEGSGCTCTYYCTQTNDVFNMDRKWPSEMEGERKEGKKGGSRKKCCSVMTRWTPGAEWDTWFPWPRHASEAYSVHVCVPSCPLDEHQLHTQTQPLTHICTCMHVIGTTPHSYWCSEVAKALRKQTATGDDDVDPLHSVKVCPPCLSSPCFICPSLNHWAACICHSSCVFSRRVNVTLWTLST